MALYPNYDRDEAFKAIGKSIARYNELVSQQADQETIVEEHIPLLNESSETRDMLVSVMNERTSNIARFESAQAQAVDVVEEYIQTGLATMLDVVDTDVGGSELTAKVLDALEDAMYLNDDSVLCNQITPDEEPPDGGADLKADIDNAGVGELYVRTTYDQQTHDDLDFELECIDASVPLSEIWLLRNSKEDDIGRITSNVLFTDAQEKYGKTFELTVRDVIYETNDNNNQLSNWVLNGAVKRKGNERSSPSLARGNSSYWGLYYVKLYDTAGTRTVELYQDFARTILVASGSLLGDGTIILAAAGGSGLTGSVDVAYVADDNDIVLKYPFPVEVGDKYYYTSEVATPALFQTFFVEQFDRALLCSGTPTVLEAWAQWGLP